MKSKFIRRTPGKRRLVVIYAGLGMDWRPFASLEHRDYDILVVWDYRELTFNWKPLLNYEEVCLMAWGIGVFAASVTVHEIEPRITLRVAINGTLSPIDEHKGISPAMWHSLENSLKPGEWQRYMRRICDTASQYEWLRANAPHRTIADIVDELNQFETHTIFHVEQMEKWDMAVVGTHDSIFPAANQLNAWKELAPVRMLDCGHLPDFRQLLLRLVIDKSRVARCNERAARLSKGRQQLDEVIANHLMCHFRRPLGIETFVGNVVEIGSGPMGSLTRRWYALCDKRAQLCMWDMVPTEQSAAPKAKMELCDAETRIRRQPDSSVAFIFSSSTVQWFNSIREFLNECVRVLVPGGILAISTFLPGTLAEITEFTGNGLQMPTTSEWRRMLPEDFEVLYFGEEGLERSFETPRAALEYLRETGSNAVDFGRPGHVVARELMANYPANERTGKYDMTFNILYIVARKIQPA